MVKSASTPVIILKFKTEKEMGVFFRKILWMRDAGNLFPPLCQYFWHFTFLCQPKKALSVH